MKHMEYRNRVATLYHLMQLCDSALPVGGFSFSCALESAVAQGVVCDVAGLEEYAQVVLRQTLLSDGVAALHVFRHAHDGGELLRIDRELFSRKQSQEWRTMSCRMGRKLTELGVKILPCPELEEWHRNIYEGRTAGCYAVAQGLLFSLCGASEQELFASVGYGVGVMISGAALRLMRITHLDTQRILFALAFLTEEMYGEVSKLTIEQINGFAPQLDILSSLHQRGKERMFMS